MVPPLVWMRTSSGTIPDHARIMGTSGVEAVRPRDLAEPAGARLHGAGLRLAVDGDQAERRAVAERPLEVVEQRPVEVAAHVEAVVQAATHATQRLADVLDALVVIGRADPVLGHVDGRAGSLDRAPDRRLERLGPELIAHREAGHACGGPQRDVRG